MWVFCATLGLFPLKRDPALLMSLADCGPRFPRMQVFGPPGLKHLLASMRMYMYRCVRFVFPFTQNTNICIGITYPSFRMRCLLGNFIGIMHQTQYLKTRILRFMLFLYILLDLALYLVRISTRALPNLPLNENEV